MDRASVIAAPQDFTTPWHPYRYTVGREHGPARWSVWNDFIDVEVAAFQTFDEARNFARECRDRHPHTAFV